MAWPDVVDLVGDYLRPLMAPVPVVSRVPDPRPDRFVQLRRVGGVALPPVRDQARLDVTTWDLTDPAAMALALTVRLHVWRLAGTNLLGRPVYEVSEFLGPRMASDPDTGVPQTWATYSISIRADDAIHIAP